ncbi:MAG: PD-(D/E)XK nuclease family protein, partial [Bacteroidales bacterium]|nr:PD-(D/E)XK nuclease family protein [Bacteroidales bacterium]
GYIDRLDSFRPDQVRIVDYKTGRVLEDDENIHDGNAEAVADKIFAPQIKDRPKIALQFFIYDMLVQSKPEVQGRSLYNCVYSTAHIFKNAPVAVPCNAVFCNAVSERLKILLDDMCDINVPFSRTEDRKVCSYCDFRTICGR